MNKLILFMLLFTIAVYSKAQGELEEADCDCEETSVEIQKDSLLCAYAGVGPLGETVYNPNGLWISVRYTITTCKEVTRISVQSFTVHTCFQNFENEGFTEVDPICEPPFRLPAAGDHPATEKWIKEWIAALVPKPTTDNAIIMFTAGCMSIVRVAWPVNSSINTLGEGGIVTSIPLTESLMIVPCGSACCITEAVPNEEGGGFYFNPLSMNECSEAVPDPNFEPQITTIDPENPEEILVITGTVIETISECGPICVYEVPSFTTDLSEIQNKLPLEFSASPTLIHDFIKFTSNIPITKIEVYSVDGKKAIDVTPQDKELNTSELKEGIYFMRVYFANKDLKTIKIQKQ